MILAAFSFRSALIACDSSSMVDTVNNAGHRAVHGLFLAAGTLFFGRCIPYPAVFRLDSVKDGFLFFVEQLEAGQVCLCPGGNAAGGHAAFIFLKLNTWVLLHMPEADDVTMLKGNRQPTD